MPQLSEEEMAELKRTLARRAKNRKEGEKAAPFLYTGLILLIGTSVASLVLDISTSLALILYGIALLLFVVAYIAAKR